MANNIPLETKRLEHVLAGIEYQTSGNMNRTEITGLCSDSKKVQPGNLFAALKGLTCDGHDYLDQAIEAGCSSLLVNKDRYGYMSCPCRLSSGDREKDQDIICPCVYRDPDVKEYGSCYCNLYVSTEWNEEKIPHDYVPERRSPEKFLF